MARKSHPIWVAAATPLSVLRPGSLNRPAREGPTLRRRLMLLAMVACLAATAMVHAGAATSDASVTRLVITETDSPTFEGESFGDVGQYVSVRVRRG